MGRCVHEADEKWGGESKGADEKWGGESVTRFTHACMAERQRCGRAVNNDRRQRNSINLTHNNDTREQ